METSANLIEKIRKLPFIAPAINQYKRGHVLGGFCSIFSLCTMAYTRSFKLWLKSWERLNQNPFTFIIMFFSLQQTYCSVFVVVIFIIIIFTFRLWFDQSPKCAYWCGKAATGLLDLSRAVTGVWACGWRKQKWSLPGGPIPICLALNQWVLETKQGCILNKTDDMTT